MSSETIRFPRLNNSNYPEWCLRMEAILVRLGLWTLIMVTPAQKKSDGTDRTDAEMQTELARMVAARDAGELAKCRAELILRVEDSQLAHMTASDPRLIWAQLARVHQAAGFATSLALRRKFLTSKKDDNETMEAWIGRIQSMVLRMTAAGITVSNQDSILALTMGLPASYDPVIINFDATDPSALTIEHVITRLLNEETRQESSSSSLPAAPDLGTVPSTDPSSVAFAAHATAEHTCYFCDKKGHFKNDCPERKRWLAFKGKRGIAASAHVAASAQAVLFDSDDEVEGVW